MAGTGYSLASWGDSDWFSDRGWRVGGGRVREGDFGEIGEIDD